MSVLGERYSGPSAVTRNMCHAHGFTHYNGLGNSGSKQLQITCLIYVAQIKTLFENGKRDELLTLKPRGFQWARLATWGYRPALQGMCSSWGRGLWEKSKHQAHLHVGRCCSSHLAHTELTILHWAPESRWHCSRSPQRSAGPTSPRTSVWSLAACEVLRLEMLLVTGSMVLAVVRLIRGHTSEK